MKQLLVLVADGMGDWPLEALGNKTPLEAAHTPNMDFLAANGCMGTCQTVPEGMQPGSDVANMALLGYAPETYHTGRGPIEAAAQGLELDPDDLVWRLNLVTVSGYDHQATMLDYSAGHMDTKVAREIITHLQDQLGDATFTFYPGIQYRHLLVQKKGRTAPEAGLSINPPHDITDQPIAADLGAYASSTRLMNLLTRARELMAPWSNRCAANAIWPWGQGTPLMLPGFESTFGPRGGIISAVDLVKGLGRAAGMEVMEIPGATGFLDTNYQGKVDAARMFLDQGDYVYLHVEAPDECGHMGDPAKKIQAIEDFDAKVLGPLLQSHGQRDMLWVLTCDHFTPIARRTHTTDPVPFVIHSAGITPSHHSTRFDEAQAARTGLLLDGGPTLMATILDWAGWKA
ncbi:cofactor-independent phosphoglycerate mutase [Desulfoplanes formicivorans]|uniref:Phosphoglycerate mutase n=1 Tax=Desulfoplanes formicivorans TaxID=1592317 RepID=A0A194AGZ9_9BACT|nr:cofactor-independent phosphoglycerate mutase [Desulfoplanes formicivorans]GAU08361.1 phosphoglycerate mutase [Desulfoplanes formicivorans]